MGNKFWNFSRYERISAIVLSILIVIGIVISAIVNRGEDIPIENYRSEIEEFKSRIVEKRDENPEKKTKKRKVNKSYTPQKQTLTPIK